MPTVSRRLPPQPHLDIPKREARELLAQCRAGVPAALERIRRHQPRHREAGAGARVRLADAQWAVAREYHFANWAELKRRIAAHVPARELEAAIRADDRAAVRALIQARPELLHLPVRSGHWGPPMSHAANLGRLEIVEECARLGARDFPHALDRAVLQGRIECARWLRAHGAVLAPGLAMGPCETLNPDGLRFLAAAGAPLTDAAGDRLAPLGLALGTYSRNPAGKHAILEILHEAGHVFPDTPTMALHRGRVDLLAAQLARDPGLPARRFTRREIYPPELGCADDETGGMHGTPVAGTTLLHLAIDYDEQEIFDWLLAHGADVDARAAVDEAGWGGHTPLFHGVVSAAYLCGRQRDAAMTRALRERGATVAARANLRKFLDWREAPGWHEARDVTPAAWARGFPEQAWVNPAALALLE